VVQKTTLPFPWALIIGTAKTEDVEMAALAATVPLTSERRDT
jgi:hypothetical protein